MSTSRIQLNPVLLPTILQLPAMRETDFFLVDVGASGGIGEHWQLFGENLRAVGFDPLVNEVNRLNACTKNPKVRYEDAFVVFKPWEDKRALSRGNPAVRTKENQPIHRTSCRAPQFLDKECYLKKTFNSGQDMLYSEKRIHLDDYFPRETHAQIDFLKVDTDGSDLSVLMSAESILKHGMVLGLSVETQFHGEISGIANLFSNIDTYLRGLGYSLFDLETYRHSRADLPSLFAHDIPAQTLDGQTMWGEATYFRDFGQPNYEEQWDCKPDQTKILKLACLFEHYGLNDCAAELLNKYRAQLSTLTEVDRLLDLLTPKWFGKKVSYREYISAFRENPELFYPTSWKSRPDDLHDRTSSLERELAHWHAQDQRNQIYLHELERLLNPQARRKQAENNKVRPTDEMLKQMLERTSCSKLIRLHRFLEKKRNKR